MIQRVFGPAASPDPSPAILILEDEVNWSGAVARLLHASLTKTPPVCFTNLAETLSYLTLREADLIFLDLNVEDSKGLATLARVREASPHSAIVVMTGEADEEMALQALRNGAQDYLVKGKLDSTVLRCTARFALERTHTMLRGHQGEQILSRVLDALPFPIALLDETGALVLCNDAWAAYGNPDNPLVHGCSVGDNYLALCDRLADSPSAVHEVAWGILQVMACLEARFAFDYLVAGPDGSKRCELSVTRMPIQQGPNVVICHRELPPPEPRA